MADKPRWTVLVYMAGDNDLDAEAVGDIREMLVHGSGTDARLVVQIDRRRKPTQRYVIPPRGGTSLEEASDRAEVLPEINTGDPRVLKDFLAWGRATFPSDRVGLVLWNHGSGWAPYDIENAGRSALAPGAVVPALFPENRPRRGVFRSLAFQRHSLFLHPEQLARVLNLTSYIGLDEGSALRPDALDTDELGQVLAEHTAEHGPLNLVGFDACLMAQLEVAYEIRTSASVLVGSEEVEPGTGWPYQVICKRLHKRPRMTALELAKAIAESYVGVAETLEGTDDDNNTHSVIRLAKTDELATATARLGAALTRALPDHRLLIRGAMSTAQRYGIRAYADLGDFIGLVSKAVPVSSVRRAARDALNALGAVVAYHGEVGEGIARSTGLSIYLPTDRREFRLYRHSYELLSFTKDHPGWLAFLAAVHA